MVKSNAERQREYRERRNAAARGEKMGEMARETIDAALVVVWRLLEDEAGKDMEKLYGFRDFDGFLAKIVDPNTKNGSSAEQVGEWIRAYMDGVEGRDAELFARAAALVDAVQLRHVPRPEKQKRTRRA